jgi:hypothetical protein
MRAATAKPPYERRYWILSLVTRTVIALNFVRFALSFSTRFEGTPEGAGAADRLFGAYIIGVFRADFAWLIFSTAAIFGAVLYFAAKSRNYPTARIDLLLSLAWIVAFIIYIIRSLLTGVLYPG